MEFLELLQARNNLPLKQTQTQPKITLPMEQKLQLLQLLRTEVLKQV
jgi:hypothetical protein